MKVTTGIEGVAQDVLGDDPAAGQSLAVAVRTWSAVATSAIEVRVRRST